METIEHVYKAAKGIAGLIPAAKDATKEIFNFVNVGNIVKVANIIDTVQKCSKDMKSVGCKRNVLE